MYAEHFERNVREAIEPILSAMGFALVELALGRLKGSTRIGVVVYRKEGVGVDDCAAVSNLLLPRLETVEGLTDVSLEVSSPGTERVLKGPAEFRIFAGRGVRMLVENESEWRAGIIDRVEGDMLWLRIGREFQGFAVAGIRKARLDHTVEVEERKNAV
jgi:ribosome maturation factor RimP